MAKHFHRELERLKKMILSLGTLVEERVRLAIKAIEDHDAEISARIIREDFEVDEMEVEIEEECLKILALHQPVAVDLRFIAAAIKINNDLERIADEAVNIAKGVAIISQYPRIEVGFDFPGMAEKAEAMLRKALDALVNLDTDAAFRVCILDDQVDRMNGEYHVIVKDAIRKNPEYVDYYFNLLLISRHLERIADHATNVAEEVIYLIEGEIIRHGKF